MLRHPRAHSVYAGLHHVRIHMFERDKGRWLWRVASLTPSQFDRSGLTIQRDDCPCTLARRRVAR